MTDTPRFIIQVLAGNIGAGKTTLCANVNDAFRSGRFGPEVRYLTLEEDVVDWLPCLQRAYENPCSENQLMLQLKVLTHFVNVTVRLELLRRQMTHTTVVLVERSPFDVLHVFMRANAQLYRKEVYDALAVIVTEFTHMSLWQQVHYIFLDAEPAVCLDRLRVRDRACETTVSLEYLQLLDWCYREHLLPNRPHVMVRAGPEHSAAAVAEEVIAVIAANISATP